MQKPIQLNQVEDQRRFQVLIGHMATLQDTMGEIRSLATKSIKDRESQIKNYVDNWDKSQDGKDVSGGGGVNILGIAGAQGGGGERTEHEREQAKKQLTEALNKAADELDKSFQGRVPTVAGIKLDQAAFTQASSSLSATFEHDQFRVDYVTFTWPRSSKAAARKR